MDTERMQITPSAEQRRPTEGRTSESRRSVDIKQMTGPEKIEKFQTLRTSVSDHVREANLLCAELARLQQTPEGLAVYRDRLKELKQTLAGLEIERNDLEQSQQLDVAEVRTIQFVRKEIFTAFKRIHEALTSIEATEDTKHTTTLLANIHKH